MNKQTVEIDREDAIKLIEMCSKAIAYEESQKGHYEITYTTKHLIDDSIREIWKLKFRLKNAVYTEDEKCT